MSTIFGHFQGILEKGKGNNYDLSTCLEGIGFDFVEIFRRKMERYL